MKEIFPNYYNEFKCIADKCKHSCCVGWEIDIDEDTMDLYNSLEGELAEKMRANITGDVPHFVLKDGERCPFLKADGLCEIICEYGDGALCDICALHPRFSNFYDDFTETGLGLCCEEAARLILTYQDKFSIVVPSLAQNDSFFKERKEVFDILQNREVSVLERFKTLSEKYRLKFDFSGKELYDFFMSLERLDKGWEQELEKLRRVENTQIFEREDLQIFFEQLACYFVFRHFDKGVGFALLSCYVVGIICTECNSVEKMLDVARMYSSEIEYSEENTQKVAEICFDKNRNIER
ncbi:MAG: flagellin lysine-N-methylase [Clostridia bacterium]|nr:flagellin lysine-N-methylase [Clostridia bacterium]